MLDLRLTFDFQPRQIEKISGRAHMADSLQLSSEETVL